MGFQEQNRSDNFNVFVYGTLRRGEVNHGLMAGSDVVAMQAWTAGRLVDTGFGYPGLVLAPDDPHARTYGEVYRVSKQRLPDLDRLEGYRGEGEENLFDRTTVTVMSDAGPIDALVYTFPSERTEGMPKVDHGDWRTARLLTQPKVWMYFAYGSVMDNRRLIEQGVGNLFLDVIGRGELDRYTLTFTHDRPDGNRADVMEVGGRVEGKVFRIEETARDYLLRREGVRSDSYRAAFVDVTVDGEVYRDVLIFLSVRRAKACSPPDWYSEEILRGASGWLTEAYVAEVRDKLSALAVARDAAVGEETGTNETAREEAAGDTTPADADR